MRVNPELKSFLDEKLRKFNRISFVASDPISIPHEYTRREDIEIAGFLTALIAWGRRDIIIRNAQKWMTMMEGQPYEFVVNAKASDWKKVQGFVHRTMNGSDAVAIAKSVGRIYASGESLESVMQMNASEPTVKEGIIRLRKAILGHKNFPSRSQKHIADPAAGSSAKRINMFLRWMVRKDKSGVDFGLWKGISPAQLICPLDVHTGNVARKLGLLRRKQNDWTAAEELTSNLRKFSPGDPVKYDIPLFALGESGEL